MQSKLARLLEKHAFDIPSLGGQPNPANYAHGSISPNVPWKQSPWEGPTSMIPWMLRPSENLMNKAMIPTSWQVPISAGIMGGASALLNHYFATKQFPAMEAAARKQGYNLFYNNPALMYAMKRRRGQSGGSNNE